jgi:ESCRT-II complex subunit VPS36
MFGFDQCTLSQAGALELKPGELILGSAAGVTLVDEANSAPPCQNGTLYVTTLRIAWVHSASRTAINAYLQVLALSRNPVEDSSQRFAFAPRLLLGLGRGVRVNFAKNGRADRDRIREYLTQALAKKHWQVPPQSSSPTTARPGLCKSVQPGSASVAPSRGVQGIIDTKRSAANARGEQINGGFVSLESLMENADALVQIAARFRILNADNQEENELLNMIAELGIESPVTKSATGNNTKLYRLEIARQMSDFLSKVVVRMGGVITIADAYCSYNRARATTELVSPDDFDAALRLLRTSEVNSDLELFKLPSGIRALQMDVSKESGGAKALASLAEERSCLTALDIVQERGIPIQVAMNMLESAERAGFLARDDTTDGVRFFPNRFISMAAHSITTAQ